MKEQPLFKAKPLFSCTSRSFMIHIALLYTAGKHQSHLFIELQSDTLVSDDMYIFTLRLLRKVSKT